MHILANGTEIRHNDLRRMERDGKSEAEIAEFYGISRYYLYKVRVKHGWRDSGRSDKGKVKVDPEERRKRWNVYQREYRKNHYVKSAHPNIRVGEKVIPLSRYNAALYVLGRALKSREVVHHKDGDTRNNKSDNLLVFASQKDHLAYHRGEDVKPVEE